MNDSRARKAYESAVDDLKEFVAERTNLEVIISEETYPIRTIFMPNNQISMFDESNVDADGEVGRLTITVGLSTSVKSTLKFHMAAALLKKLIKLSERAGNIYYQAYREGADEEADDEKDGAP